MSPSSIYFTSLGSVGEVGASAHLIEIDGLSLLLDCGLHPKKEGKDALPAFKHLRGAPDAVLISHAHHDHCASLPYLLKMHPGTAPFATAPTVRILDRMLHNSVSVMEKMQVERGIADYPLYDHNDVDFAIRRLYGIPMNQEFAVLPKSDVRVSFTHAGHVLGSACVLIEGVDHRILYTGDICVIDQELMHGIELPKAVRNVDTLVIESTYGANETAHEVEYKEEVNRFAEGINRVLMRDGVVLVPAFALGRTQEVLNMISRLQDVGRIPYVPVYASGLGRAIYEVYSRFPDELREDVEMAPLSDFDTVGDVWDPKVVRRLLSEPSIIVATSGMMIENTPAAMIAEQMVRDERHGIFFTGYCDPDTLGYKVRTSKKRDRLIFQLGGRPTEIVLEDIQWFHFSAHAHRQDLLKIIDRVQSKNVIFVHGDPPAVEWMYEHGGDGRARYMPHIGEPVRLSS